jgi:hypothetical protein
MLSSACRALPLAVVVTVAVAVLASATPSTAQVPGEWRYRITTDMGNIPVDMQVNFPTISFAACRSSEDFSSGRAFALQTLASSAARCPSSDFARTALADGSGDSLRLVYACDDGKTLSGTAQGRVQADKFTVALESRYTPPVNGVSTVKQTMIGQRVGVCKIAPDADALKIN